MLLTSSAKLRLELSLLLIVQSGGTKVGGIFWNFSCHSLLHLPSSDLTLLVEGRTSSLSSQTLQTFWTALDKLGKPGENSCCVHSVAVKLIPLIEFYCWLRKSFIRPRRKMWLEGNLILITLTVDTVTISVFVANCTDDIGVLAQIQDDDESAIVCCIVWFTD